MTLDEMKVESHRLYVRYCELKETSDAAGNAWCILARQVEHIEKKEQLRAELLAELKAEQEAAK
jgi:hypothetical protein